MGNISNSDITLTSETSGVTNEELLTRVRYAIKRINRVGWGQQANRLNGDEPNSPGCLVGSCFMDAEFLISTSRLQDKEPDAFYASSLTSYANLRFNAVFRELQALFGNYLPASNSGWPTSGTGWNDRPGRTKEEVLELLATVEKDLVLRTAEEDAAENTKYLARISALNEAPTD